MKLPQPHQFIFPDRKEAILLDDFSIDVRGDFNINITAKEGLIYNGFSVPWPFEWIQSRWGEYIVAALLHDLAYATHFLSNSRADYLFVELLQMYGDDWFHRNLLYSAVRSFGWVVYPKTKKELESQLQFVNIKPI